MKEFFPKVNQIMELIQFDSISSERKSELKVLIDFIQLKVENNDEINLNFICTHNSRRSQFGQLWAKVAADYFDISINSFSGGTEETAFNERAIESLRRFGFEVDSEGSINPKYSINWRGGVDPLVMFSKLYDDEQNPKSNFAAIMTCAHADDNCPFVAGCESRIPIRYNDPKAFDDSPLEEAFYDVRSFQIATEMMYVFSEIHK